MSLSSDRLFRAIEYRSRLQQLSVSGTQHAAYFSNHPDELAVRLGALESFEKQVAAADIGGRDRESMLAEASSYRKELSCKNAANSGPFDALKPTLRDAAVAAAAAYAAWKGRGWLEAKAEEFARRQAAYVAEELKRG